MEVSLVPHEYVANVWPSIEDYMEKAAAETFGRYTGQDILDLVMDFGYTLWIAFEDSEIKGAVVSGFNVYPQKKYLDLLFCGGEDGHDWKKPMLEILQRWAKDNQCAGIEGTGRAGWSKIFKGDGVTPIWQVFELPAGED